MPLICFCGILYWWSSVRIITVYCSCSHAGQIKTRCAHRSVQHHLFSPKLGGRGCLQKLRSFLWPSPPILQLSPPLSPLNPMSWIFAHGSKANRNSISWQKADFNMACLPVCLNQNQMTYTYKINES